MGRRIEEIEDHLELSKCAQPNHMKNFCLWGQRGESKEEEGIQVGEEPDPLSLGSKMEDKARSHSSPPRG